jgi:hypothetical protein
MVISRMCSILEEVCGSCRALCGVGVERAGLGSKVGSRKPQKRGFSAVWRRECTLEAATPELRLSSLGVGESLRRSTMAK